MQINTITISITSKMGIEIINNDGNKNKLFTISITSKIGIEIINNDGNKNKNSTTILRSIVITIEVILRPL
jgi:hypothetical protein